jgi:hypothetical protein
MLSDEFFDLRDRILPFVSTPVVETILIPWNLQGNWIFFLHLM